MDTVVKFGRKWLDFSYILKVEPFGFADELNVRFEREPSFIFSKDFCLKQSK